MHTVKLVVIGASSVGKTSLRTQYVSGRFSTGYRATIGADFIAKTLPHPTKSDEVVTLQIWDTAGQERFSSLSTAFFRGADAVLLMFDVNQPETLAGLTKWWQEFRERAPLYDEDLEDYCCVVVGNKTDLVNTTALGTSSIVSAAQALRFLDDLVPPSTPRLHSPVDQVPITVELAATEEPVPDDDGDDDPSVDLASAFPPLRSQSIDIDPSVRRGYSKRSSWSSTTLANGTLASIRTGVTSYHTPSSSLFDTYASARSSPLPPSVSSRLSSPVRPHRRASSSTTSSAPTITPSLFMRGNDCEAGAAEATPPTPVSDGSSVLDTTTPHHHHCHHHHHPLPPEKGPKLFFTSAKTGDGVREVFEYIAQRVVTRWEYEETMDARTLRMQAPPETIRLGMTRAESGGRLTGTCC